MVKWNILPAAELAVFRVLFKLLQIVELLSLRELKKDHCTSVNSGDEMIYAG